MLYQLSLLPKDFFLFVGKDGFEPPKVERQQIYSLPHLATLVFAQLIFQRTTASQHANEFFF